MQYTYEYNDETHTVELERQPDGTLHATIGERTYTLDASQLARGGWLLRLDDARKLVYTAADNDERYVFAQGKQWQLNKVDLRRRRKKAQAAVGDLTAEMPGQVIDVRVSEGDSVASGAVLVVLEAMKMEIRTTAPYDGTVTRLLVNTGDVIERGQTLVEVTPDEE